MNTTNQINKNALIADPCSLLEPLQRTTELQRKCLNNPYLAECHCFSYLNRPPTGIDLRRVTENVLLSAVDSFFPDKKEITICSIGSGSCFQELVIHELITKTNKTAHWILIDKRYRESMDPSVEAFTNEVRISSPATQVTTRSSLFGFLGSKFSDVSTKPRHRGSDRSSELDFDMLFSIDDGKLGGLIDIGTLLPSLHKPCMFLRAPKLQKGPALGMLYCEGNGADVELVIPIPGKTFLPVSEERPRKAFDFHVESWEKGKKIYFLVPDSE